MFAVCLGDETDINTILYVDYDNTLFPRISLIFFMHSSA